jgi:hypothetical protein
MESDSDKLPESNEAARWEEGRRRRETIRQLIDGAVAICVGIDFGAISSMTRLPDHAARSIV